MNKKKISIVLPVYNGEDYLGDSIKSIINQTYKKWELIIVNDCSTDDTLKICHEFEKKDSRIRVISNERNLKLPSSLNMGFSHATGDYYTWTSHDNMYKPQALEVMARVLAEDSTISMVYAAYTNIDSQGNELDRVELQEPKFIVAGNVCGACFLYTADIAKRIGGYDPELFLAEDYDYWLRIYRYGKLKHINDDLYYYRRHEGSLTETRKEFIDEQTYKVLEKNFLPLYYISKRNGMVYRFFDEMLKRGARHLPEVKKMLVAVNSGYLLYYNAKRIKHGLKRIKAKRVSDR